MVNLSAGQVAAYDEIMKWYKSDDQVFVLAGYAGTGKSTMASKIAAEVGELDVYYCAYTGKAANVLRDKGCQNTNTIHGFLYDINEHSKRQIEELNFAMADARARGDDAAHREMKIELEALAEAMKRPKFLLNLDSELKRAKLVIVDEYSMLPDKVIGDLLKVSDKVLFIGDPYQLPPVEGECGLEPDAFLDEIHRQAMDSSIIKYSKVIRDGGIIPYGRHGDLDFITKREATKEMFLEADQLIVGRNNTRAQMNDWYRRQLGFDGLYPMEGEKLICLRNNHSIGLFNGLITTAKKKARYSGLYCHLKIDVPAMPTLKCFTDDFTGGSNKFNFSNPAHKQLERFTYGYAITCHKSQGSEFDNVAVINEPIGRGDERRRWLYTALTRGKKHCTLVNQS